MNIKIILKKFSSLNVSQHSQRWCKGKNLHIYIYSMLRLANIFFPINNSKTIKIDTKCHNTRFYVSRRLKYSRKGAWDGCERAHQRIAADANQQSTSVTKSESYPSRGSVPHCSPKKEREMNTFWKLPLYFAFILDSLYFCFLPVAAQFFYNFLLLLVWHLEQKYILPMTPVCMGGLLSGISFNSTIHETWRRFWSKLQNKNNAAGLLPE